MGLYQEYLLPRMTHWACQQRPAALQRAKIVPEARGRVLEIGIGSGLNLDYYRPGRVEKVWGLEPSAGMLDLARRRERPDRFELEFIQAGAESIPLESHSVDTVLTTFTLCTVPELDRAFAEMRRVMKPGGQLLFCEHGRAPDASVRRWQNFWQPVWKVCAGGCHLNRDIPALLRGGGFTIRQLETMYLPGWKPAGFNFWGQAIL